MATTTTPPTPGGSVYGGLGPLGLGVSWALFVIATILLGLRYYVMIALQRPAKWPVIWVTTAYVGGVIAQICMTIGTIKYGIGNHITIVAAAGTVSPAVLWTWITLFWALWCIGTGKAAAASLLIALQGPTKPRARMFLLTVATINILIDGITMIALWFQCSPPHKLWDSTAKGACNGVTPVLHLGIVAGSINAFSDVLLAFYPAWMVWQLKMPKRVKLGLSVLMGFGVFTGVCAAIKTSELPTIANTSDPTYAIMKLVIWGLAEQWIVVIVSLIPPTWPLLQPYVARATTGSPKSRSRNRSGAVHLPDGDELGYNLRGQDSKTSKSRGYVADEDEFFDDGSTRNLNVQPGIVTMRQELTTTIHGKDESVLREREIGGSQGSTEIGTP